MAASIQKLTAFPAKAISSFNKAPGDDVQCEGWLLKNRRRKGYVRRYFILRASGVLAYALHSQLSPREQFSLNTATISSNSTRREIHIDCQTGTYHVKATSAGDFEMWMVAFRQFIHVTVEGTLTRKFSVLRNPNMSHGIHLNKFSTSLDEISSSIQNLKDIVKSLKDGERRAFTGQPTPNNDQLKPREGLRHMFRRSSSTLVHSLGGVSSPQANINPSSIASDLHYLQETIDRLSKQFEQFCASIAQGNLIPTHTSTSAFSVVDPVEKPSPANDSRRGSTGTFLSGDANSTSIWYDASEGPEEFVITDDSTPKKDLVELAPNSSGSITTITSSFDTAVDEGDLDDEPGDPGQMSPSPKPQVNDTDVSQVIRRTILPAPISGDEISLFALLRKNIGKDLSTISFPVTSNEPLGLLQRACEDIEYCDLLDQACLASNPTERMCLVTAFAVSGFACTRLRSGRKPFTPMLAETFEDRRSNFIAEKVSNHPLIVACHAQGTGWEWWATNAGKNHFWGKSLEIEHTGTTHLRIGQDRFQWSKPSCFIRNLMYGTKYLEHVGSLVIENNSTGMKCIVEFKETGYWGTPNVITGTTYSPKGKVETRLEGTWHEQISQVLSESHLRVLWRANSFPKHAANYYGLTSFATTLNEITSDIEGKLPPTDTRYRPDLRALEEGDISLAETEKLRVETAQRERRSAGAEVAPRWFKKVGPEEYVYVGGYWEQRSKGWNDCPKLW